MRLLLPFACVALAAGLLAGCSSQKTGAAPPITEPVSTTTALSPAGVSPEKKHAVVPPPEPAGSAEQGALDAYTRTLRPIIESRDLAEALFRDEMRKHVTEIDKKGMKVFLAPYSKYDAAVERAVKKLQSLKPPPGAKRVHEAIIGALDRLNENLDSAVAAIQEGKDEDVAMLSEERKNLDADGAKGIEDALIAGGFDTEAYSKDLKLVRKEPASAASTGGREKQP